MSSFSLDMRAFKEVRKVVAEFAEAIPFEGAEAAVADARAQVEEMVGSGVKYPDLPNRSSAPYEAPVSQFGGLLESIVVEADPGGTQVDAVADGGVAYYLELGTSKMAPRPFMGPAAFVGEEVVRHLAEEAAAVISETVN